MRDAVEKTCRTRTVSPSPHRGTRITSRLKAVLGRELLFTVFPLNLKGLFNFVYSFFFFLAKCLPSWPPSPVLNHRRFFGEITGSLCPLRLKSESRK